jgi:hypothetical protein
MYSTVRYGESTHRNSNFLDRSQHGRANSAVSEVQRQNNVHQSVKRCRMDGVRLLVSRGHALCYVRDHDFPKRLAFADS